jgi:dihydrofolate reductase
LIVSAIVAVAKNGVIGNNGQIPWYLPEDLKYFKKITMGYPVIMGRKSFISIGRPLPGRENIVITRDIYFAATGCLVVQSIPEALKIAEETGKKEAFIIGGGEIYNQSIGFWDKLYITQVDTEVEGDVFFPNLDWDKWRLISEDKHWADPKNEVDYNFQIFEKK